MSIAGSENMVSGSELIGRALALEGVKNVFTIAGDHVLPALDSMADMGFRFVDTRHEQAAAHMADAWGRITGEPGVAMYTTPGFSNAIPGLTNAQHSESPLLSISGSAELSELGRGAMQEIDQVGMARPVTKGAWMVTDTRRIPDMIAHALRVAYSGRRGPVHLTIPVDIQQNMVSEDEVAFYAPGEYRGIGAAQASQADIEQAIAILRGAKRPLIVAGSAASYGRAGEATQEFIETTRLPLLTEGDARGMVSDEHPYCLGFFDQGLSRASRKIREADVVVMLGRKQDLIIGYAMSPTIAADAKIIQVDPSEAEIGRNRGVAVGIAGDVEATMRQMTAEASKHSWSESEWIGELRAERRAWQEHLGVACGGGCADARYVRASDCDADASAGRLSCVRWRGLLPLRAGVSAGADAEELAVCDAFGDAGAHDTDRAGGEAGASGAAGNRVQRRRGVRVQRHGVRHGGAASSADCVRAGERFGVGHRSADTARRVWEAGGYGPAAHALRPDSARAGGAWRNRGESGGVAARLGALPEAGASGAHQCAGAAGGESARSGCYQ